MKRPPIAFSEAWIIWSFEHDAWWAANECGYTPKMLAAGVYTKQRADEIVEKANIHGVNEKAVMLREIITQPARHANVAELLRYAVDRSVGSV